MNFSIPSTPDTSDPLVGFRFVVFFLGRTGISHPLDFRFQSVSGLSVEVQTGKLGADTSVSADSFPMSRSYSNLVLKRGMPKASTLRLEIQESFEEFQFHPRDVLVSLLDEQALPHKSWMFKDAYPIRWSLSDLDASTGAVVIEEMHLAYHSFKSISL